MFDLLLLLTAAILLVGTFAAYVRSGDLMHPLVFLGPLFFLATVIDPWLVRDQVYQLIPNAEDVEFVLRLNLACVLALVTGAFRYSGRSGRVRDLGSFRLADEERKRLRQVSLILAIGAAVVYAYGIVSAGGFIAAFAQAKGGGQYSSGYLGEARNLGLVSAVMAAVAQYRRGWTPQTVVLMLLGVLPSLIQGTVGGRRGPLFVSLTALGLGWLIVRRHKPRVWAAAGVLGTVLLAVLFVWSQRQHLYMGSESSEVRWDQFVEIVTQEGAGPGNNFIYGSAFIVATEHTGRFTRGRELLVNVFIRPIPRQIWPTKYEDVGATWVTNDFPGLGHLEVVDWLAGVGWVPLAGSSAASISDLFGEFGLGVVPVMYVIGLGFAYLRLRSKLSGGVWELLYLEAMALSIYLATQSFSAFYHRYLILAVPTVIVWSFVAARRRARRQRLPPVPVAVGVDARTMMRRPPVRRRVSAHAHV